MDFQEAAGSITDQIPLIKAHFFEAKERPQRSGALLAESDEKVFGKHHVIKPIYDQFVLARMPEYSNSLQSCISAYKTNIDGHGFRLEPRVHIDSQEATDEIIEHLETKNGVGPTPAEIEAKRQEVKTVMAREYRRGMHFFKYCAGKHSFVTLRMHLRQDIETTGNGYLECRRNGAGEIVRMDRVPAFSVRLMPATYLDIATEERRSLFDTEVVTETREVRTYIQSIGSHDVFFKDLYDPRVISRKTGKVFQSEDDLYAADKYDAPATELIHFKAEISP